MKKGDININGKVMREIDNSIINNNNGNSGNNKTVYSCIIIIEETSHWMNLHSTFIDQLQQKLSIHLLQIIANHLLLRLLLPEGTVVIVIIMTNLLLALMLHNIVH